MSRNRTIRHTGLARALSKLGYCSRSMAFTLIRNGRVRINGRIVRNPEAPVVVGRDRIEVDGTRVGAAQRIYLMLNKPRGIVTTSRDEKGRDTVYSLLPEYRQWLAPVGRLDKASEGLLLMTNDSAWAARISVPESHVEKTYHVQVDSIPAEDLLSQLVSGVRSEEGEILRARSATVLRVGAKNCWLEVVLEEGKNRQIRRMLAALEMEVLRLVGVAIGPLRLGDLAKGKVRELTHNEIHALNAAILSRQNLHG
jgi:23S rRNA pseudouridine2605 synthase